MNHNDGSQEPLLTLRSAVVLLTGAQAAIAATIITYTTGTALATATLVGAGAFGATITFLRSIIR